MKKNKSRRVFLWLIIIGAAVGGIVWSVSPRRQSAGTASLSDAVKTEDVIEYWTCSMHPQVRKDGPGKCPICGMELVPIYKTDKDKIVIDSSTAEKLGIKSEPAARRHFVKIIRLPGKVSHDLQLYTLQQEYLSVLATFSKLKASASSEVVERERALLEATRLRLKLLGFSDVSIQELEKAGATDGSLIYPSKGKVWIQADIYEQDISLVKSGQKINAAIRGYETEEFTGEIKAIETTLNPQTRAAKARIEVDDPQNKLRHEMYADLRLELDLGRRLGIPRNSLIDTGIRKVVYLDLGSGRYQLKEVKTGAEARSYVEVIEGIREGDLVVSNGNFLLDSQTTLTGGQSLLYGAGEELKETSSSGSTHRH